jgi:hypothetical protein
MRLWVFKRHFSTIFQLYIDLWATFPGANMVQGRNTLGYLRNRTFYIPERKHAYKYASITKCLTCSVVIFYYYLFVGTFAIIEVNLIWESTLSKSDYLVGRESGYLKIFFTFLEVNMSNILGYLRYRTFYIPERKYAYKYASITKCLTCSPREM